MFGYEKIYLSGSFNWIIFILLFVAIAAYSFFVYRFTLPPVSNSKKILLSIIRWLALSILLFIFFEPVLSLSKKVSIKPLNIVLLDNSKSIKIQDGTNREQKQNNLFLQLKNLADQYSLKFYTFGEKVKELNELENTVLTNNESFTDFSKIFSNQDLFKESIASFTIISDGVITNGSSPLYSAEKFSVPVFTIGLGDSSYKKDIIAQNILFNDFIYQGSQTSIAFTILNRGFDSKQTTASLYEGNKLIESKNITLDASGVNTVIFNYTPEKSGEQKLSVKVESLDGEITNQNNQKSFFLKILSNKIRVLLVSGSPSPDLTFIKNSLSENDNYEVSTLTQLAGSRFIEGNNNQKIDSADVIFLLSYPNEQSSAESIDRISERIISNSISFFALINSETDINKLNQLKDLLPISIQRIDNNYIKAQPDINISEKNNPIISSGSDSDLADWNSLPPILYPSATLSLKPGSKIISKIKIDNTPGNNPLIVSRSLGSKRSVILLGKDIWRWKLQMANKSSILFDSFITNVTKWLNLANEQNQFVVKTSKKFYSLGEDIEIFAQVFDESLNPINNAEVKISFAKNEGRELLLLSSVGNGFYEGRINLKSTGDFTYTAEAIKDDRTIGKTNGIINIGDVEIEKIDTRMNAEFLIQLSNNTNGKFYLPDSVQELIEQLEQIKNSSVKEKYETSEIRIWSNEWSLIIVILLFSIEWFLRKRSGML